MISLETLQGKWASCRLEGRTSWIFSIGAGVSTYDGDIRDPLWWPQERPVPMRVVRGPLRIPLPSMPGPKILCGFGVGHCAFLSSADMDLGVLLESPQGSQSSSRVGACTCSFLPSLAAVSRFSSRGSRDQGLSHEAFPQGCHTCHRGVSGFSA